MPLNKQEALDACKEEHLALLRCMDVSRWCMEEDKAFWSCYREKRGQKQLQTKFGKWWDELGAGRAGGGGGRGGGGGGGGKGGSAKQAAHPGDASAKTEGPGGAV